MCPGNICIRFHVCVLLQCIEEDELVSALHAHAEKFDERAEFTFGYLQVFSAICVVFAHGAGECYQTIHLNAVAPATLAVLHPPA